MRHGAKYIIYEPSGFFIFSLLEVIKILISESTNMQTLIHAYSVLDENNHDQSYKVCLKKKASTPI